MARHIIHLTKDEVGELHSIIRKGSHTAHAFKTAYPALFTLLALCRCKASNTADIVFYFKVFATKQMHKDKSEQSPKNGNTFEDNKDNNMLIINNKCSFLFIAMNNAGYVLLNCDEGE